MSDLACLGEHKDESYMALMYSLDCNKSWRVVEHVRQKFSKTALSRKLMMTRRGPCVFSEHRSSSQQLTRTPILGRVFMSRGACAMAR